jgi:hypothetical protein
MVRIVTTEREFYHLVLNSNVGDENCCFALSSAKSRRYPHENSREYR